MSFKDIYIAEVERIAAELEEDGLDPALAYDLASNLVLDAARNLVLDAADNLRKREREG